LIQMNELASLWIGESLGEIELASIYSILRHGNRLTLYSYAPIHNVPKGVETCDASEIFPTSHIMRYRKTDSPALHANLFRYALIAKTEKIWVDLDIIALKQFNFTTEHVFAFERANRVNNAVLGLPFDSPTLNDLCQFRPDTVGLPPNFKGLRYWRYLLRTFGKGLPIDRWPWGSTGPRALTHYLQTNKEIEHALPIEAFYSVAVSDVALFLKPGAITCDSFPAGAVGVHLWGKELRKLIATTCRGQLPKGSFLEQVLHDDAKYNSKTD
jgi:hypothetical protein